MKIYCYRTGEIGFALQHIPAGSILICQAPHGIAEHAVHQTAQARGILADGSTNWIIPGMEDAWERRDWATTTRIRLEFEARLRGRITTLRNQRISSRARRVAA